MSGDGRIAAYETVLRTIATESCIRTRDMFRIQNCMLPGEGMQTMERAIAALKLQKLIA